MDNATKLAYRILASLYPDRRPSEIRKIIEDVLSKEERKDDAELWMNLTRQMSEIPKEPEPVSKTIIERHEYHHYDPWYTRPWYATSTTQSIDITPCITCLDDRNTNSCIADANAIALDTSALLAQCEASLNF